MTWDRIALTVSDVLGVILIIRLLALRLQEVYRVFCFFVAYELFSSSLAFIEVLAHNPKLDYRITYIVLRAVAWVIMLWMVYALLDAILAKLPGILKFSRRLLNAAFSASVVIALLSAKPEFSAVQTGRSGTIDSFVITAFILERVISTVALGVLLAMLGFVFWFPVQIPRNLLLFSIGYVAYFALKTGVLLARLFLNPGIFLYMGTVSMFALSACFLYWALTITAEGESAALTVGHRWHSGEQERLVQQLESMNAALLRGARR